MLVEMDLLDYLAYKRDAEFFLIFGFSHEVSNYAG